MSFLGEWVKLDIIVLNEETQTQEDKYWISKI